MKPTMMILCLAAASATVITAVAVESADAAWWGTSAFSARARSASDDTCFREDLGEMVNDCSTQKELRAALNVDHGIMGSWGWTVMVTAHGPSSSSNVGCLAWGVDKNGFYYSGTSRVWLSSFGSRQDINVGTPQVPRYGSLLVSCVVDPNARVSSFNWWS